MLFEQSAIRQDDNPNFAQKEIDSNSLFSIQKEEKG